MRESYKGFVKTWIRFANPWICTVSWLQILTPKRFVSYHSHKSWLHRFANPDLWVRFLKIRIVDSFRDLNFQRFELFSRIQQILTNPDESWRILSTMAQNESLRIHTSGFANPDLQIQTLKIRFVDSFRRLHHKLPVSWFGFVEILFKYPFCGFVLWKFFFQITWFVLFRKDLYTNIRIPHP
jgi:hypothetical protein